VTLNHRELNPTCCVRATCSEGNGNLVGYFQRMRIPAEQLPLHGTRIDSAAGEWLIAVQSAMESQTGGTILLKLLLECSIDEERFQTREVGMTVYASEVYDSELLEEMRSQIRHWIETTEGDGFLDLTHRANQA
jgi:hypothetical protein